MNQSKLAYISDRLKRIDTDKRYKILNKKKSSVVVKDGIISYKLFTNELKCQCMKNDRFFCDHLLFVLKNGFMLDNRVISHLDIPKIRSRFITYVNKNGMHNLNTDISNYANQVLLQMECGICLNHLYKKELYQCNVCYNYTHFDCMHSWIHYNKKTNDEGRGCIYCSTKITNSLGHCLTIN